MPDVKDRAELSGPRATPAMRQFYTFKQRHPGCLLLFRMGDFYETFDDDAVTLHKALGVTLTERTAGVPMAGVPYHAIEPYLRRLIEQGYRVAVCEQVEDPKQAKGVVERAVTRVLTPGALVDESLLADDEANVLGAVAFLGAANEPGAGARCALALVEVSTGSFTVLDCAAAELVDELMRRGVRELLYAETADGVAPPRVKKALDGAGVSGSARPAWHFRREEAMEALLRQYGVTSLAGFGLRDDDPAVPAAGAIVRYLRETQAPEGIPESHSQAARSALAPLSHLRPPKREQGGGFLVIDAPGMRALEVERTVRGSATGEDFSLVGLFLRGGAGGGCRTSMGKRLVREWLRRPLAARGAVEARHACVGMLVGDRRMLEAVGDAVEGVQDVARIGGRVALGRATPRDLCALGRSLVKVDGIVDALRVPAGSEAEDAFAALRARLERAREALCGLAQEIGSSCGDDPPGHLRDGGLFRDGVDAALDEARLLQRDSAAWLAEYQRALAERHGLPNIKVGYNKVFGYFIELPRAQAARAPEELRRTQTLTNAERYTTPELKQYEDKVMTARERGIAREQALFDALCARAGALLGEIALFAEAVAEVDALRCFAAHAARRGWARPEMTDGPALEIEQGRHPVLESILTDGFVPNDLSLGGTATALALITGPNMAGKSTFIRQTALIALLAHAGSFVPAARARIGMTDRIFTRVGADDALHAGQSTFMVEMTETANILHHCTQRSLIALDEIGRGTSTLDGLALAWAIGEFLAGAGPRTLFATHYHELTQLEELMPGRVQNLHVAVREWPPGDPQAQIVFLHRILSGRTDRSYGVQVARLAGLPTGVVSRARELLETLAVSHEGKQAAAALKGASSERRGAKEEAQMALFREYVAHPAVEELKKVDLERMTALDAFDALRRLRGMVE